MSREDKTQCTCDREHEEHPCPYQEDINNNIEYVCSCCPHCEQQCRMDI